MRLSVVATAICLSIIGLAGATEAEAEIRRPTNIPAQGLAPALQFLAKERDVQVVYRSELVGDRRTSGAAGDLTFEEALSQLLSGTGLTYHYLDEKAITIVPLPTASLAPLTEEREGHAEREAEGKAGSDNLSPGTGEGRGEGKMRWWQRLAQATSPAGEEGEGSAERESKGQPSNSDESLKEGKAVEESPAPLDEVLVTGSRLPQAGDGAFPVNVYTREQIDRSGQPTLGGFLSTLPEIAISSSTEIGGQVGQTTAQLRGLPLGTTLTLINGRRTQSAGSSNTSNFINLDVIPFAAIERIEILPVGSSAVYGGDALAGVINIILKDSVDELAFDIQQGNADSTDDKSASLYFGQQFGRGSFSVIAAYRERSPLSARDREFFVDADYRRFGGVDARTTLCTPGTVSSGSAANLPGLMSPVAGIPEFEPGTPITIPSFAPTAGVTNSCGPRTQGYGTALAVGSEDSSLHASGDLTIFGSHELFGEFTLSDYTSDTPERALSLNNVLVPASNAFNPFGADVRVTARLGIENGDGGTSVETDYRRYVVGLRGELGSEWEYEAAFVRNEDESRVATRNVLVNTTARAAALASSDPNTALNPFTTGRAAPESVLRGIWSDQVFSGEGRRDVFSAFARGPLFDLPAGPVDFVLGAESSYDEWTYVQPPPFATLSQDRDARSVFGEARVPIIQDEDSERGLLSVTFAGRWDDYSDFGDATTYQAGAELRPLDGLLLRLASATSFKPPTLQQLSPASSTFLSEQFALVDPRNGNVAIVGVPVTFGPNPDIQPEEGSAETIGIVWQPWFAPDATVSVTAWSIDITELITLPFNPQFFLTNEAQFPGYVTREPSTGSMPGPVTGILWANVNFGRIEVAGTDAEFAYSTESSFGTWDFRAAATHTSNYDVQIVVGTPSENRLGKLSADYWAPEWKGSLSVSWSSGPWSLGMAGRYLGSYDDIGASTRQLGDIWYTDLSASVTLNELFPQLGLVRSATLSAVLVNATDELPEYASTNERYDRTQSDWRGRYLSLRFALRH